MDSKWNEDQPQDAPSWNSEEWQGEKPEAGSWSRPMSTTPGEVQEWVDDDSPSES